MEYAVAITPPGSYGNNNTNNHVGWTQAATPQEYQDLFTDSTVIYIKQACANYLMPIMNQPIEIPDDAIRSMITSVWNAEGGGNRSDVYTEAAFNLPHNEIPAFDYKRIVYITIEAITKQIKNTWEMEQVNNTKLDIWSQLYGTFNKQGLQAYSLPKHTIKQKRPTPMLFNMNY